VALTIADTDVLIDALRGREPGRSRIESELKSGFLATTSITLFELWSGAQSSGEEEKVNRLLSSMEILPLDETAGREAARVRRELEEAGTPIGTADYLIAGICLSRSAVLLTRNADHFQRVPGLVLSAG
jgi:predicted nucleic acid-binding protein